MTAPSPAPALRRVGTLATLTGSVFAAVGTGAWLLVRRQLSEEQITVPGNAPLLAGRTVSGPVTAYVEASVIKGNAERGAGGRTFAEISEELRHVEKGSDQERQLRGQSAALSTAAALRTSLMTSVLAFGVSALAVGIGGVLVLAGRMLRRAG